MSAQEPSPRSRLLGLIVAFRQTQCISVAAGLRIADHLGDRPLSSAELAAACGADEPFLRRLLRALVALGLLDQEADGRYRLTAVGQELGSAGLAPVAHFYGAEPVWSAWRALEHSVRTGGRAFERCTACGTAGSTTPPTRTRRPGSTRPWLR